MSRVAWGLLACALLAFALTPLLRALFLRVGVVDRPGPRSMHTAPIATLGGLGMFLAFAAGVWRFAGPYLGGDTGGLLAGAAATLAVGAVDDLAKAGIIHLGRFGDAEGRGLRPVAKAAGQLLAAGLAVAMGVRIAGMTSPLTGHYVNLIPAVAVPATIVWIFCVSTVINLIDGLDGLATGVVAIAASVLLITSLEIGQPHPAAMLSAIVLGISLGFLPWNWAPASIIMGDSGALFLGYALAAVSVEGALKSPAVLALAVPVVALGLPVFDAAFAIVRRWRRHGPVGAADREHLHHRLVAMGLSTRDAVLMIYIASGWLGISAIALDRVGWLPGALLITFIVTSLVYIGRRIGLFARPGAVEAAATKPAARRP